MAFELGDVFLTRNTEEVGNDTPGHWNHTAVYAGHGMIIEAQGGDIGHVREIPLDQFANNYPEILVLRLDSEKIANKMSIYARALLGVSYRKIASIFKFLRKDHRGHNCVSVVRKCYRDASGDDPGWKWPDDILNSGLFNIVSRKP